MHCGGESLRPERIPIGHVGHVQRWFRGPAVLPAHPDQREERFESEARLAVRRGECRSRDERGRPKPGRSDFCPRRSLHVNGTADDRRAESGDRDRDLEIRSRKGRSPEPRRVVLARRRPGVPTNPRGNIGWPAARARRRNGKTGSHLRGSRRDRPARGRGREVPEDAVLDGLARDRLQEPDHHGRAGTGRQP